MLLRIEWRLVTVLGKNKCYVRKSLIFFFDEHETTAKFQKLQLPTTFFFILNTNLPFTSRCYSMCILCGQLLFWHMKWIDWNLLYQGTCCNWVNFPEHHSVYFPVLCVIPWWFAHHLIFTLMLVREIWPREISAKSQLIAENRSILSDLSSDLFPYCVTHKYEKLQGDIRAHFLSRFVFSYRGS